VIEEMENARHSQRYPLIVVDAALIFEISIEQMFDVIIVVYANMENRIKRVMSRDHLKRAEILSRVHRQIPLKDKKNWADFVIDNNGSKEDLMKQVQSVYDKLTANVRTVRKIRV
jgi:dephospho-CoA kinase